MKIQMTDADMGAIVAGSIASDRVASNNEICPWDAARWDEFVEQLRSHTLAYLEWLKQHPDE